MIAILAVFIPIIMNFIVADGYAAPGYYSYSTDHKILKTNPPTTDMDLFFSSGESEQASSLPATPSPSNTEKSFSSSTEAPSHQIPEKTTSAPVNRASVNPRAGRMKGLRGGSFFRSLRHSTIEQDNDHGVLMSLLYVLFYTMLTLWMTGIIMLLIGLISYISESCSGIQPRQSPPFPFKLEPTFTDKVKILWQKCITKFRKAPNGIPPASVLHM